MDKEEKSLLHALSSLRQRNFRLFWFGQMISLIGSWMQSIGQVWLVLDLTHSSRQLALVGALQLLPVLLFSLFGGVVADRWPKRPVLLLTQSAAMIQALLLWALLVTGNIQLWHLYLMAILLGLTNSLDKPTQQAFIVEIVEHENLPNAIALNSLLVNLARIVGPSLGGIIIATRGVPELFLYNALSFLAVLVSLALIKSHKRYTQTLQQRSVSIWQSIREGMSYIWSMPVVLLIILVVGLVLLFGSNFNIFLPLFATDVLKAGATGFGFLSAAFGTGSLFSALWLAWSNHKPTVRRLLISMLIFGVLEIGFALSHNYFLSTMLIASLGFTETTFAALAITTLQIVAPEHLRGRVMSVYILFFDGSVPFGYLLVGWLSGLYGASLAQLICACLSLIVVGAGWLWYKQQRRFYEHIHL
jgi:MFS family permease